MHIDWKCIKCGENHLTLANDIDKDTTITLTCSTCNTTFSYKILSIKYSMNCLICDSSNTPIKEETISSWY